MNKVLILFALVFQGLAYAETLRFKTPPISGKLIANNLQMTDWQTVVSCSYNFQGTKKTIYRYPQTTLKKVDSLAYSLKIKAATLQELPHLDVLNCSYKLTLIGKNLNTHQLAFGEILLLGKDSGVMSESELQSLMEINQVTRTLNEKTKELAITYGKDGGIVEDI